MPRLRECRKRIWAHGMASGEQLRVMEEIAKGVFFCGIHDRTRKVFDQLVPLPQGTTYNSYLIVGSEKCALIDTMYEKFRAEFLDSIVAGGHKIDYIVSNHAEPDHSGAIPPLLEMFPEATVLCSPKCAENLSNMLHVDRERIRVVADGETVSLGDKTLSFISAPWVHWPDTMFTYIKEDSMLFTCDFLGAHYTNFKLFADNSPELALAARRYYAEIMMPFRSFCVKYLAGIRALSPKMILPSHGPIYDRPDFILNLYEDWTSDRASKKVLIPYVSMYDNSKLMCEYLAGALERLGVEPVLADIMEADEGELAMELVDAAGAVFGTSMVLTGPHPKSVYIAYLFNILRPKLKFYSIIGSFGWAGRLCEPIDAQFNLSKPERLDPVIVKGRPRKDDFIRLDALAESIASKCSGITG